MLDSMFQEGTDKVLDDRVARPLQAPTVRPSFGASLWNTSTALPKGIGSGANDLAGFAADIFGAFGQVQAGYGLQADPTLLFGDAEKRQQEGQAARDQVQSGEAFSSDIGSGFRATSRSFSPDPATANTAEQILFGLGRFGVKAIGYTAAAGPAAGAALLGADEGTAEADRLKAQGVDFSTRTKAGAVVGAASGAAVALPVAGNTLMKTAALVAVGGPGSFVAQQAASRAILQHAGYDQIASQYDPFDPVGLAVSTLVPAAFGGLALRGAGRAPKVSPTADAAAVRALSQMAGNERQALAYNDPRLDAYATTAAQLEGIPPEALLAIKNVGEKSAPTAVSPKGAQGVMQFMPDTWTAYGKGDPRDPIASIDAGARYMKDLIKQYDGDVRAAIAHYNGGGKAGEAVRAGKAPPAAETRKYLARADEFLAQHQGEQAGRAAANDPEAIAAARVQLVRDTVESWNLKDPADVAGAQEHLNAILRAQDQLGAGERVDISSAIGLDNLNHARVLDDMIGKLETAKADLLPEAGNMVTDPGVVRTMRDEITQLQQVRPQATEEAFRTRAKEIQTEQGISYKAALSAAKKDIGNRITETDAHIARLEDQMNTNRRAADAQQQVAALDQQIAKVKQDRAAIDAPTPKPAALAVKQAVSDMPAAKGGTKVPESGTKPDTVAPKSPAAVPDQATGAPTSKPDANPIAASLDAQSAEIARLSPDMMVQLEGMDKPMRLADAMDAIKAEAAKDVKDAPLLQIAAECFLRSS